MTWKQCGPLFVPSGKMEWSKSHAQAPSAYLLDDRIRIYFGTRDANNRSRPGFFDLDRDDPSRVMKVSDTPVMDLGKAGTHDEDGVVPSHIIARGAELLMYYGGVSRGGSVPYRMSIGLAVSGDGGLNFERVFDGPIVDRTPIEPYMTMAPYVIRSDGDWSMWYGSGTEWIDVRGRYEPTYQIKCASSTDGVAWSRTGEVCIPKLHPSEANTRPSVARCGSGFEMWFCYRGSHDYRGGDESYRIGYARSHDGLRWTRESDPEGLMPRDGWNSAMMAYPNVIDVDGRRYMFHNGNGFGKSGVGYAIWSEPVSA